MKAQITKNYGDEINGLMTMENYSLDSFEEKFKNFFEYESKIPGIKVGLQVLEELHLKKNEIVLRKDSKVNSKGVRFYDFVDKTITEYCVDSLNQKFHEIYKKRVLNKICLNENKLHLDLTKALNHIVNVNGMDCLGEYPNGEKINSYDFLKFFYSALRHAYQNDGDDDDSVLEFEFFEFMKVFEGSKFYSEFEDFKFLFDIFIKFIKDKIISYDGYYLKINKKYKKDLIKIMCCSLDIMFLGDDKQSERNSYYVMPFFSKSRSLDQLIKFGLNKNSLGLFHSDILTTLVILCSVERYSFSDPDPDSKRYINNIFFETTYLYENVFCNPFRSTFDEIQSFKNKELE